MNERRSVDIRILWLVSFLILAAEWLVALAPAAGRTWGGDGLRYLSWIERWVVTAGGIAVSIGLTALLQHYHGKRTAFVPWLIPAAAFLAVVLLPPATHLRGDGQLLIDALVNHRLLPLRAPMTSLVAQGFSRLPLLHLDPEEVFRVIGVLGFLLHLVALIVLFRHTASIPERVVVATAVMGTGSLLLYAGLAEYYALASGLGILALACSLAPLRRGSFPRLGLLLALATMAFHVMGVVLLPAFALALAPRFGRFRARILFGVFAAVGFVFALIFAHGHMMPPFGPLGKAHFFAEWGTRILDGINLLFWMVPGAILLLIAYLVSERKAVSSDGDIRVLDFYAGAFLGAAGYVLLFHPDLGMARDADLMVLFGLTLTMVLIPLIRFIASRDLTHLAGALLLAVIVTVGSQMTVQSSEQESIQRHTHLLEMDASSSAAYGWEFLGQHYLEKGDYPKAVHAYTNAWKTSHNPRYAIPLATLSLQVHQPEQAKHWAEIAVDAFPDRPEAQASLGASLYAIGKISESAAPLEKALQGGLADPTLILLLSDAWLRVGRAGDSVDLLDRAFTSGLPANGNLLTILAQGQEALGHPGIAAKLYGQALQLRPQEPFRSRAEEGWGRLGYLQRKSAP